MTNHSRTRARNTAVHDDDTQETPESAPSRQHSPVTTFPSASSLTRNTASRPQPQLFGELRILPTAEISVTPKFIVRNPRSQGPQVDICTRVPGQFNTWVASMSCYDTVVDAWDLVAGAHSGLAPPRAKVHVIMGGSEPVYVVRGGGFSVLDGKMPVSMILWTNQGEDYDGEDRGELHHPGTNEIWRALGEEGMKMVV
ncbi:hypothetical protein ACHAPU_006234 [Fusarium lateritium]